MNVALAGQTKADSGRGAVRSWRHFPGASAGMAGNSRCGLLGVYLEPVLANVGEGRKTGTREGCTNSTYISQLEPEHKC